MKYLYILLLCLIIYYIISRFYEKYTENFDPSLVPVSSIVTLAKVAQKLVDGGGTLTNPGNLQIGTPSAIGNLLVTGNTVVTGGLANIGVTQLGNTLGVTGATNLSSTLGVTGATTLSSTLGVTGNTTVGGTLGVTGDTTVGGTLGIKGNTTIGTNGAPASSLTVTGDTIVSGLLTAPTVAAGSSLNINARNSTTAKPVPGYTLYSDDGTNLSVWHNGPKFSIDQYGNVTIVGTLTINGTKLSTNSSGELVIDKPISGAQLTSPTINGATFLGNQQWKLGGNGSSSDQMFEFRDSNTGARKAWMGWTWGSVGSGYN